MHERLASASPFRYPPPDEATLFGLVRDYEHVTGDPVKRPGKRNLVATCHRTHGDDFLPLVQLLFAASSTALNLLGIIRTMSRSEAQRLLGAAAADELDEDQTQEASPFDQPPLEGAFPPSREPKKQSTSHRKGLGDAPEVQGFFADDELRHPAQSPTSKAVSR